MGYSLNNKCYATNTDALNAFKAMFPMVGDYAQVTLMTATVSGSTITYGVSSAMNQSLSSNVSKSGLTMALGTCTLETNDKFANVAVQDILVASAFALAFVVGIVAGKLR